MAQVAIRQATEKDMPTVYALFCEATEDMNAKGIAQWDGLYPTTAHLDDDLAKGELCVGELEGRVVCAVALNEVCDPQYQNAQWQGSGPYIIVHRLCVSPSAQGKGVGRAFMSEVENWALERGYRQIRLDSFAQNPQAQRMYQRLGYAIRGEAHWRKGLFYLMEKELCRV